MPRLFSSFALVTVFALPNAACSRNDAAPPQTESKAAPSPKTEGPGASAPNQALTPSATPPAPPAAATPPAPSAAATPPAVALPKKENPPAGTENPTTGPRDKAKAQKKNTTSKASKTEKIAAGETLFLKKCRSCHGSDGAGKTKMGKRYEIESLVKNKLSTAKIKRTIRDGVADTKMRAYKNKLNADEIDALVAFVAQL